MNTGTKRQQKFARLIQKELGEIFQKDKRNILGNAFVSVVDVQVSTDLSFAKIYLGMMLIQDKQKVLDVINTRKSEIRKALGNRIAKQVRHIPELAFFIDEVEENAMRLDALIDSLNIPPKSKDEEE
ncbi:MAG TPA: 30S ribosome-binding factor RbfA [Cyclobacteriaceae bacterium]|nr:30S ribosome-binding factor RbfA [Cyclobacteriaceae bacterium]